MNSNTRKRKKRNLVVFSGVDADERFTIGGDDCEVINDMVFEKNGKVWKSLLSLGPNHCLIFRERLGLILLINQRDPCRPQQIGQQTSRRDPQD